MQKKLLSLKLAIVFGAFATSVANAEIASEEMLANTCVGCHGTNGVSNGPAIPSIAGMSETYFVDVMSQYAKDERASTIMGRIARGYSEEELKVMGGYFAKQPIGKPKQSFDEAKAKKGKELHDKYCEKCHSEGGSLGEDDAGILAGQWAPYIKYTLHDFATGARDMPKKMKKKINKMRKKEGGKKGEPCVSCQEALTAYYASQQ